MSLAEASPPRATPTLPTEPGRRVARRAVAAGLLLLAAYAMALLAFDPRGFLGTDTGGKVATLRSMGETGSLRPDVGYWAAPVDPDGQLHPLYYTVAHESGDRTRYVNVTTLPMLLAAQPLYALGGYRLALLLPMLGGLLCAAGAFALARRLGSQRPWLAYWVVGLASPVTVYALDLWEHTLGLGLMVWGTAFLLDLAPRQELRPRLVRLAAAGACFGLAGTMRTEALLYGAIMLCAFMSWRTLETVWRDGSVFAAPFLAVLAANQLLERALIGGGVRAGRAADTAGRFGHDLGVRLEEGLRTTLGMNYAGLASDAFVGVLLSALVVAAVVFARRGAHRYAIECLTGAGLVYGARFFAGLNFISGAFAALPLAVVGLTQIATTQRDRPGDWRARRLGVAALGALPAVWLVQFTGGAGPQWGGRYVLLSGVVLAVLGLVGLDRQPEYLRVGVVALCVAVTGFGLVFASQRTHDVADSFTAVIARDDEVVISRVAHLLREGGAWYTSRRRWLTAVDDADYRSALRVAMASTPEAGGPARVAVVAYRGQRAGAPGWTETDRTPYRFLSEDLVIVEMERR